MPTTNQDQLLLKLIHAIRTDITLYNFAKSEKQKNESILSITELLARTELFVKNQNQDINNPKELNLSDLVKVVLENLLKDQRNRVKFTDCKVQVKGSRDELEVLMREILLNALTYSDGDVYLSIHNTGSHAVIRVEDFGIGITDSVQISMAEPFMTSGNEISGHGLGLALIWAITKAHGGALTVLTDENQGTTVLFSLNLV